MTTQPPPLTDHDKEFYRYCCLDSAVTYEISSYLEPRVNGTAKQHYKFNLNMLIPLRYMELRGIRYATTTAESRRQLLRQKMYEAQAKLNGLTGFGFSWHSKTNITRHVSNTMCFVRDPSTPKKDSVETYQRFQELWFQPNPTLATIGEIEDLCEVSLNEGSNKQLTAYLYDELKLPVQLSDPDPVSKKRSPTANYEALLKLTKHCKQHQLNNALAILDLIIEIRALDTRQRMLSIHADRDGRIRCGYNIVGSETGRITCYRSPTGSGYNLQTIPKYTDTAAAPGGVLGDRDLFIADDGCYIFECDLEGADSWTVAAYCALLGDRSMLTDLLAGIRPAKRITLKLRGAALNYNDPAAVLAASADVSKSSWDYFACKRVVHGGSYMEGGRTIGRNILKDSEGKMFMDEAECNALKKLLLDTYPGIVRYHQYIGRKLSQNRQILTAASGQIRQFFGNLDEILTKAVAFEPQANTTYATNLAMWNLWTDRENRIGNHLRIEPLHQVHDALVGQFKITDTAWAVSRIKRYFSNPLQIAGQTIVIPYEGGYGPSWGSLKVGTI